MALLNRWGTLRVEELPSKKCRREKRASKEENEKRLWCDDDDDGCDVDDDVRTV